MAESYANEHGEEDPKGEVAFEKAHSVEVLKEREELGASWRLHAFKFKASGKTHPIRH